MNKRLRLFLLILSGLAVGFISGFLGAGGGILLVPILLYIFKEETKTAHATAVLVILPVCLASGLVYILSNNISFFTLLYVAVGNLVGGVIGTFLLKNLKSNLIEFIFSLVMVVAGVWMVFHKG